MRKEYITSCIIEYIESGFGIPESIYINIEDFKKAFPELKEYVEKNKVDTYTFVQPLTFYSGDTAVRSKTYNFPLYLVDYVPIGEILF